MAGYIKGSPEHIAYLEKREAVKDMIRPELEKGLTCSDIAKKLNLKESVVRALSIEMPEYWNVF